MFPLKPARHASRLVFLALPLALSTSPPVNAPAQAPLPNAITILMLDGKTGKPLVPNNYIVRLDHRDAIHNEALQINDDGLGKVMIPVGATFFSVQGTYRDSLEIYINCDAGMEKDTSTLHWYSIDDIMKTGVAAPDECYKGKYTDNFGITPKPGEFIFFVREISWRDKNAD